MIKVEIVKSKISVVANKKQSKRDKTCIRIGTKSISSYTKATTQFNLCILPSLIKMRRLSCNFLNSISIDILEMIYCSEDESMHDSEIERCRIHDNTSLIGSKSSSTPPDNPHVLQSKHLILDSRNVNIYTLKDNSLDVTYLNNLLYEFSCVLKDNNINML